MSTNSHSSIRLVRHATLLVTVGETTFLVDPMLASPGANPPIQDTPNQRDNPLVPMPDVGLTYDAVVVTHRHTDHFDEAAKAALDPDVPLFCQPADEGAFVEDGFTDVRPIDDGAVFDGITIHRTPGRHGHGELAEKMAPVSGFVFEGDETLYIAGDTIWYDEIAETLERFDPDTVVLNAGEARFDYGEPITMGVADVTAVREATDARVVAVHMEAINHCLLTRDELRANTENVRIPEDGELITL
ncbi:MULTISPECIES: MBL fold metallo-hydrolase [Haloferax]|uniref:MBL fold metallo-hydrolase n=1 Tax=Haloferax marinum TaxID=2666143 RepID=A0A6A8GAP2_9EURY|nr:MULTISPECIES: MBL fold metallo-hydrolase [Haloferax]KAB1190742.1 MBL fold metallo-hydrolase [Haloferax sp. CBA1150]MRW98280.1 MBL fold metallo-hydrolase [Haloferax marinum]